MSKATIVHTPKQLAAELGKSPKAVRRMMRARGMRVGRGNRHQLTDATFSSLLVELAKPQAATPQPVEPKNSTDIIADQVAAGQPLPKKRTKTSKKS